jgi:hypothetical protein
MITQDVEPEVFVRKVEGNRYNPFLDSELSDYLSLGKYKSCKQFDPPSAWVTILRNSPGALVKAGMTLHFKHTEADAIDKRRSLSPEQVGTRNRTMGGTRRRADLSFTGPVKSNVISISDEPEDLTPSSSPCPPGKKAKFTGMRYEGCLCACDASKFSELASMQPNRLPLLPCFL